MQGQPEESTAGVDEGRSRQGQAGAVTASALVGGRVMLDGYDLGQAMRDRIAWLVPAAHARPI